MPSPTNKDRDEQHRRRRQVGDSPAGSSSDVDGREAARKLYGGFARKDDGGRRNADLNQTPGDDCETTQADEPTLFDDAAQ